ncbi:hypothetical protein O163_06715 [Caldanaerobacter subterraneus subsp. yonseiensis KB-1]|uniref:Helicase C-terminal domain-containing protein n=1 Tax=Caldanaerobacter subterraneus subsp. yonseiensis KB-1 TaxID=1388761 RepID=U5CQ91_CALSX|nr:CRISPR-associated helicase Cas3' [Caldanaerobacter subterraneus]ERM92163.1 hypothetical protein O163_06715 [Caldanaerobacter subterraneus subsp. yonseiensis KB-1]
MQLEGAVNGDGKFKWFEKDEESLAKFVKDKWCDWKSLGVDGPQKIIVFVNTVDRAIKVYDVLKRIFQNQSRPWLLLAHSRFTRDDRRKVENKIYEFFGKQANPEPAILVTTQVAEAGLNISAPLIITDLCPMDSLIQRAGRCQRFKPDTSQGFKGKVIVVKPAGDKWYVPYSDMVRLVEVSRGKKGKEKRNTSERLPAIELTQIVLETKAGNQGLLLNWKEEQELIERTLDRLYRTYLSGTTDVEFSKGEEPYNSVFEKHKPKKHEPGEVEEELETEMEEE